MVDSFNCEELMKARNVVIIGNKKGFMGNEGFELGMFKWKIIKLPISKDCLS